MNDHNPTGAPHVGDEHGWLPEAAAARGAVRAPAAARVLHASSIRGAALALADTSARPVVHALGRWAVRQLDNGGVLDAAPLTAGLLAARSDLVPEQVAAVLDAAVDGLAPLATTEIEVLGRLLETGRRAVVTRLLSRAAADQTLWRQLQTAAQLTGVGVSVRVPVLASPTAWAVSVVRAQGSAAIGHQETALLIDGTVTPGGLTIQAVRSTDHLLELAEALDLCFAEELPTWTDASVLVFTACDSDGTVVAVGHVKATWRVGVVHATGPGNIPVTSIVADDLIHHVAAMTM